MPFSSETNGKIIRKICDQNVLTDHFRSSAELGLLKEAFPVPASLHPLLIWHLQFAFLVAASKLAEQVDAPNYRSLPADFLREMMGSTRFEVRVGDYVKARRELDYVKRKLDLRFALFAKIENRRVLLSDITMAVLPFRVRAMVPYYEKAVEDHMLNQWGAIQDTSQVLAIAVAATFLGNPMEEMSDIELMNYTDPFSEIIADMTYEIGVMLGYRE
jgi:hypothetical protein